MRRVVPLVLLALVAGEAVADGGGGGRPASDARATAARPPSPAPVPTGGARAPSRLHLVRPLARRLSPDARANARATGKLVVEARAGEGKRRPQVGTGFLAVAPDAEGRALVMTNQHVVADMEVGAIALVDAGGRSHALPVRLVLADELLDYALLEVVLPVERAWRPVVLTRRAAQLGEPTYSIGFAHPARVDRAYAAGPTLRRFDEVRERYDRTLAAVRAGGPRAEYVDALGAAPQTIAVGRVTTSRSELLDALLIHGSDLTTQIAAEGGSGSAIFSRADHRVVGLVHASFDGPPDGAPRTLSRSISRVLDHVETRVADLPPADRALVGRLLDAAETPARRSR